MTKRDDPLVAKFKRVTDLMHETMLVSTILSYARSGHASDAMIEAAAQLTERHIASARELGDESLAQKAQKLRDDLRQVLIDGVETLRRTKGPNPEKTQVEDPLASERRALGHRVRQQMRCKNGIVDIYDLTADELIECKLRGTSADLGEAAGQLQRYRQSFPGAARAIAVPFVESEALWLADLLRRDGITIIEVSKP